MKNKEREMIVSLKKQLGDCLYSEYLTLTDVKLAIEEVFLKYEGNIRTRQLKENYIMQKLESIVKGENK